MGHLNFCSLLHVASRGLLWALILLSLTSCNDGQDKPQETSGVRITHSAGFSDIDTGAFTTKIHYSPFSIESSAHSGADLQLFHRIEDFFLLLRDDSRIEISSVRAPRTEATAVVFDAQMSDGSEATLKLSVISAHTLAMEFIPANPERVTHWGQDHALAADELIYGLTERIVDDWLQSEIEPAEVGSLDRRGEKVRMYVFPTIAAYAPFHQSSEGFGFLVGGTMPGEYDIGVSRSSQMRLTFEFDPSQRKAITYLFYGPDHASILDEYSRLTGRPFLPPREMFLHWRGRDELPLFAAGKEVMVNGVAINPTLADELLHYSALGIPPGVYHFDRPWAVGPQGYGEFRFDQERFPNAQAMLQMMTEQGWTISVWASNWAIGQLGEEALANNYLIPGSDRAIDFTNPSAKNWLQEKVIDFLTGGEGQYIRGFFLDRSDESDVKSKETDRYFDGRNGREMHNAYPLEYVRSFREAMEHVHGNEGWCTSRATYTGTQAFASTWGGDTHSRNGFIIPEVNNQGASTDLGLRSVLISMQRAAFMGLPYWGSDIGGYSDFGDREVFARWIEIGALSPLMRFHGQGNKVPWDMPTTPRNDVQMTNIYRTYILLHHALVDYLMTLAQQAHSTGLSLVRPLVFSYPNEPGARNRWDEWLLGEDLLVAPVWRSGAREREVYFPSGRWVDFWNREHIVEGPVQLTVAAPLEILPLYIKAGSSLLDLTIP